MLGKMHFIGIHKSVDFATEAGHDNVIFLFFKFRNPFTALPKASLHQFYLDAPTMVFLKTNKEDTREFLLGCSTVQLKQGNQKSISERYEVQQVDVLFST